MRLLMAILAVLYMFVLHAAHLAPWDTDGDGMRVGMSANGGGVVARRVSSSGVESFSCDLAGNLLSASNSVAAETFAYDGTWNLASELMASNPNFRNAGVQNAVYQAVVDEWGSPLKRLGAYDNAPFVMESEIVDAVWDLGAAATVYRNLGGKTGTPIGKLETDKITPDRFRRIPNNLPEELTLDEAINGAGNRIMENKVLGDPRYSGMEKWQHVHVQPDGTKIVIHFVVDPQTGVRTDFKFK